MKNILQETFEKHVKLVTQHLKEQDMSRFGNPDVKSSLRPEIPYQAYSNDDSNSNLNKIIQDNPNFYSETNKGFTPEDLNQVAQDISHKEDEYTIQYIKDTIIKNSGGIQQIIKPRDALFAFYGR